MIKILLILLVSFNMISCEQPAITFAPSAGTLALLEKSKSLQNRASIIEENVKKIEEELFQLVDRDIQDKQYADDEFINIEKLSTNFILDIKYATPDNFLKKAVYSCQKCFIRGAVAKSLLQAQKELFKMGYRIKLFDCYRPHSVQKKMWELYPNPGYVADPKGGSVHNRGAALDMTLTDLEGKELGMGTAYDHFGKEAAHAYPNLSKEIKTNRKLLRTTMEQYGFKTIRTEWWHYNFVGGKKFEISDFTWECE